MARGLARSIMDEPPKRTGDRGGRVYLSRVEGVLRERLRVCREAADNYAAKATGQDRDFYLRMSATERCAATEVLYLIELICGQPARDRAAHREVQ